MAQTRQAEANAKMRKLIARGDTYATPQGTGGRAALRRVRAILASAQDALDNLLRRIVTPGTREITARLIEALRLAFGRVVDSVLSRLAHLHTEYTREAMGYGWRYSQRSFRIMAAYEKDADGLEAARGLTRSVAAVEFVRGLMGRQHNLSAARLRGRMLRQFDQAVRAAVAFGATPGQLVETLTGGAPMGRIMNIAGRTRRLILKPVKIVKKQVAQVTRIVRTEISEAMNRGAAMVITGLAFVLPGGMQKKIVATWDLRTAYDSKVVHGQIRDPDQPFTDGAGRVYMLPPARPNDREIVIPWRRGWRELPSTRPRTAFL